MPQIPPTLDVSRTSLLNISGRSNSPIAFLVQFKDPVTNLPFDISSYDTAEFTIKKSTGLQPVQLTASTLAMDGKLNLNNSTLVSTLSVNIPPIPEGRYVYDVRLYSSVNSSILPWEPMAGMISIVSGYSL